MWNRARGRELKKRACYVNCSTERASPEGQKSRPKTSPPHRTTAGTGNQPPVVLRYTGRGSRGIGQRQESAVWLEGASGSLGERQGRERVGVICEVSARGDRPPLPRRLVTCRLQLESHRSSAAAALVLQAPYRASLGRRAARVGCQFSFRDR